MLTLKQLFFGLAGIVLVFCAIALAPRLTSGQNPNAPGGNKPAQDVNVVNTPLPVTGTITVGNTSPVPVRDVDVASRQPFQARYTVPLADVPRIQVPLGKRLVFEFISLDIASSLACQVDSAVIQTFVGGTRAEFIMPATHAPTATNNVEYVGQMVKLYADPGTEAVVNYGFRGDGPCNSHGFLTVSGYFENVP